MKRFLLFCAVLALFCASTASPMTYEGTYYKTHLQISGDKNPIVLALDEIEGYLEGTTAFPNLMLTPGTAPTATEGSIYYDSASKGLLLRNDSAWVTIDTAGASSLGTAYTAGSTVSVITDPITLTVTNTSNNRVLDLVQNDTTNNLEALRITNTGSGDTLAFVSTGGKDVDGTGSSWSVTHLGVGSYLGLSVGASAITLQNSETIGNGTNNGITFDSDTATTEDFTIGLGANTDIITFSSASGATTVDWGTMTTLSGMTAITGDAADLTIQITADAGGEDLLIQQAGAQDASLDLRSAGTGTDAIKVLASAGGIDVDSTGGVIAITTTADGAGDDITINAAGTAQDSSLILTSDGTGGDAVSIITTHANGDVKINSGDMIDIDAADDFLLDVAGAAGEDILVTNTGGSITLSATEDVEDAIFINATTGGINITADGAAASDVDIVNTNGSVNISGGEAITTAVVISAGTAGGGIDITSNEDIDITTTGAATEDISITNTGGSVIVTATEADADAIVLNASAGGVNVDALAAYDVDLAGGQVLLVSKDNVASAIALTANVGTTETIVVTNTKGTAAGAITLTATAGGVDIDAAAAKEINIAGGNVAIVNKTAGATAITLIENVGATDQMVFTNTQGTNEAAIDITATAGGIDIDAAVLKDVAINGGQVLIEAEDSVASAISLITNTGVLETIVVNNMQGTDDASINIDSVAGGLDVDVAKSLTLSSSEGSADSVVITSTAGGIDILADTTNAGSEDIDITLSGATDSSIILTSSGTGADAVKLHSNGGTASGILVHAQTGTAAAATTETDASIQLKSTLGGIGLSSALNAVDSIRIEATAGANSAITIQNIAGTAASATTEEDAAIQLYSQVGGIGLSSGLSAANAIRIETSGAAGLLTLQSIAGTGASATTEKDAAIQLYAQAGGIGLSSDLAGADAIRLETSNAAGIMELQSIAGTGVSAATEHDASIQLYSQAGGIGLNSGLNAANAIRLETNGGVNEQIILHANQGTSVTQGTASIQLISDLGGINLTTTGVASKNAILINAGTGGGINVDATEDIDILLTAGSADEDILITTSGATDNHITITSTGTSVNAIGLQATAGGIDIDASTDTITITNTADGDADDFTLAQVGASNSSLLLTSEGTGVDAIGLTAASGGITINAGTGLINFSDDALANIGDIAVDDIVDEADADVTYMVKTVIKTIWLDDDTATPDFEFDDDAVDSTAQNVDLGAIIPAYAEVIGAMARCYEATGAQTFQVTVGTASAGSEILAQATIDAANEIAVTVAGSGPIVAATSSVRNVWVNGNPSANWSDVGSVGKWAIIVTYIDYGAAYTQNAN